jgi:hypothetical protein
VASQNTATASFVSLVAMQPNVTSSIAKSNGLVWPHV